MDGKDVANIMTYGIKLGCIDKPMMTSLKQGNDLVKRVGNPIIHWVYCNL